MARRRRAPSPTLSSNRRETNTTTLIGVRRSLRLQSLRQPVTGAEINAQTTDPTTWLPPSPESAGRKRRRPSSSDEVDQPRLKKRHRTDVRPTVKQDELIDYWIQNKCQWSQQLQQTVSMEFCGAQKRTLSRSNSWKASTDSGNAPRAWGGKHATVMQDSGIFMEHQEGASIAEDDEQLCKDILAARYSLPTDWRFQSQHFLAILKQSLYRNKSRVTRDLWEHIMPSPELHHARGHPGVEHIAEGVDAQWTKFAFLCGPKPRPDMCHGVSRSAFTKEEREKLTSNIACACETMFFPFYICEAKCFDRSIEESELQALHGASVACNTMINLYEKISMANELHRRVLAFSVSHDQRKVKIFGHFAMIDDRGTTFHRHRLFETDLIDDSPSRNHPYHIALGIWQHFYPLHLARIRHALSLQPNRAMESFSSQRGLESSRASTPYSSQEDVQSKRVSTTLAHKMRQDNESLRAQLCSLTQEIRAQREDFKQQLAQQKEDSQKQLAQQTQASQKLLAQLIARLPKSDT